MGNLPEVGSVVRVRQRQYLVEGVDDCSAEGLASLVHMSCIDDDAQGQPLSVFWEHELDAKELTGERWENLAKVGFDDPELFSSYLHTIRWNCVTSTDPELFQAPFRAGIKIEPYQLEPLRKALKLPRVNLFIADDVGLGKTIEAALIARELLLRKKINTIVVTCPPSMLLQWKEELEVRFGLIFEIYDKKFVAKMKQERGYKVNPWHTHSRFLISHRLLIDEGYVGPMRDWLGEVKQGSLLILDEAHHAAPSSGSKYAIDSQFTKSIRDIASRFEHRLFLSATPHNGHSNSFSALLEILDPQRFIRGFDVDNREALDEVMVRRLKEDLREVVGGFPKRIPAPLIIENLPKDQPELRLAELLDQYRQLREERLAGLGKRRLAASNLIIVGLQQRLLSSIEAFFRTLKVHRKTMLKHWSRDLDKKMKLYINDHDLVANSVGADDDRAELSEDELLTEVEAQFEKITLVGLEEDIQSDFNKEREILDEMYEIADVARHNPDAKVQKLFDWIRANMCPGVSSKGRSEPAKWNETRIIIFTEWDDSKRYLVKQLNSFIAGTDLAEERIEVFHGPTSSEKREDIKRAFNSDPKKEPLRILVATDAAREGLNLQSHCNNLFHYDIPWNPSRMEQRNGRIDRKLQPAKEVYCRYFLYADREEDKILDTIVRKTETIKKELGSLSQVIDGEIEELLKSGIQKDSIEQLEEKISSADIDFERKQSVERELEQARKRKEDIVNEVEALEKMLERSRQWINLSEDHFQQAITASLKLSGFDQISSVDIGKESGRQYYTIPGIEDKASPSWIETLDTLRRPRKKSEKLWEWRRDAPLRPLSFHDIGEMDDSVVHLHLEHRLIQRLLGRFLSQGFVSDELSRTCLLHSSDKVARVILLGRFSFYGPKASRLHEEIVPIAARWSPVGKRKKALEAFKEQGQTVSLEILEKALLDDKVRVRENLNAEITNGAAQDIEELMPLLEEKMKEFAGEIINKLYGRGEAEADSLRKLLEGQREQILKTRDETSTQAQAQMSLFEQLTPDEKKQHESNKKYWEKRLDEIDKELEAEPEKVKSLYQVKAVRPEPVGLIYLIPEGGTNEL